MGDPIVLPSGDTLHIDMWGHAQFTDGAVEYILLARDIPAVVAAFTAAPPPPRRKKAKKLRPGDVLADGAVIVEGVCVMTERDDLYGLRSWSNPDEWVDLAPEATS